MRLCISIYAHKRHAGAGSHKRPLWVLDCFVEPLFNGGKSKYSVAECFAANVRGARSPVLQEGKNMFVITVDKWHKISCECKVHLEIKVIAEN